jgi:teichuronic acid biosynthesis glycosyltransferase TuaG
VASPLVSVVVPTFNRPELLVETLKSILIQTYRELDIIVVDNHSNYDVGELVASLGDSRVRLFQIHNGGFIGASRNVGIEKGWGSLVAFCDDDDLWEPNKVRAQVDAFDPERHGAVATSALYFGDVRYFPRRTEGLQREARFQDLLERGTPALSTLLLLRSQAHFAVEKNLQHVEDFELLLRVTCGGKTVRILPDPLVRYRVHSSNESLNRHKIENSLNVLELFKDHMSQSVYQRSKSRLSVAFGINAMRAGAPARVYFKEALTARFSLQTLGAWLITLLPPFLQRGALLIYYSFRRRSSRFRYGVCDFN